LVAVDCGDRRAGRDARLLGRRLVDDFGDHRMIVIERQRHVQPFDAALVG
jgi:hypothetical protein